MKLFQVCTFADVPCAFLAFLNIKLTKNWLEFRGSIRTAVHVILNIMHSCDFGANWVAAPTKWHKDSAMCVRFHVCAYARSYMYRWVLQVWGKRRRKEYKKEESETQFRYCYGLSRLRGSPVGTSMYPWTPSFPVWFQTQSTDVHSSILWGQWQQLLLCAAF